MDTVQQAAPSRKRIDRRRLDDVVVLQPLDVLDDDLAGDVREQVLEAHAPVVIDLDHCVQLDASAITDIATSWQLYRPDFCFACSNPGDRGMLGGIAGVSTVAVFPSVDDALASLDPSEGWTVPD